MGPAAAKGPVRRSGWQTAARGRAAAAAVPSEEDEKNEDGVCISTRRRARDDCPGETLALLERGSLLRLEWSNDVSEVTTGRVVIDRIDSRKGPSGRILRGASGPS